jgi:hypothetical protein
MWMADGENIRGDKPSVVVLALIWVEVFVKGHDFGFVDINLDSAFLTP